ncbi:protein SODIUM POTASSIUM ROOT DEFECTIVE 2-like isoform X1 [Salvia splendens]|uniref:protein SODIUM POTASSIUM ROOT DEFECTIVE 2-like isoform X1 n=1 Tax=Salvia splendens TaxID=180675 RepID=UPI001C270340|nr:protein SODIUM POTASSIUM ROOT DEFECTIVE 2-like isoform X1 [Salvia splendens]
MKSIEVFCASPASTAICSSTDHRTIIRHGMRSVHRLGETPRSRRSNAAPCSSHLPFEPSTKSAKDGDVLRRKSSADVYDLASRRHLSNKPFLDFISDSQTAIVPSQPLVRDSNDKRLNLESFRSLSARPHESPVFRPSSTDSAAAGKLIDHLNAHRSSLTPSNRHQVSSYPASFMHLIISIKVSDYGLIKSQVVELRVSIHCKGCEGKLRKHISRMEGVTSFSIDLETKKVTVIGRVTPLGVLSSISKVKNAQFWPSPASSSSSSSPSPSPRVTTLMSPRVSVTR